MPTTLRSDGYNLRTTSVSWQMPRMKSLSHFQPRHFSIASVNPETKHALRAMAWVVRAAHRGDLPLFASTLGLDADEFQALLREDVQVLSPNLPSNFLSAWLPEQFTPLVSMLWSYRVTDAPLAHWLSHAIAAGCYGRQHLWQDLGFNSRDDVSRLINQWFPRLFDLNTQNLKWKRFLFEQLGNRQGEPGLKPPSCWDCDSYRVCFARG